MYLEECSLEYIHVHFVRILTDVPYRMSYFIVRYLTFYGADEMIFSTGNGVIGERVNVFEGEEGTRACRSKVSTHRTSLGTLARHLFPSSCSSSFGFPLSSLLFNDIVLQLSEWKIVATSYASQLANNSS